MMVVRCWLQRSTILTNVVKTMPYTSHDWEGFIVPINTVIWGMVSIIEGKSQSKMETGGTPPPHFSQETYRGGPGD